MRDARRLAGFENATEAARAFGWTAPTYLAHENGGRGFPVARARAYARAFNVSTAWLLTGEGPQRDTTTPLIGIVGAGSTILPIDDHALGAGLELVETPPAYGGDLVAVQVRGDSMYPVYWDGDVLFFGRSGAPILDECLNRECVVRLADGAAMVKVLRRGAQKQAFRLESYNAPPIENADVEWAAPVAWVDKRRRRE
ncbi:MAG: S24 family peptidase [Pseudomonadota bacterium]